MDRIGVRERRVSCAARVRERDERLRILAHSSNREVNRIEFLVQSWEKMEIDCSTLTTECHNKDPAKPFKAKRMTTRKTCVCV